MRAWALCCLVVLVFGQRQPDMGGGDGDGGNRRPGGDMPMPGKGRGGMPDFMGMMREMLEELEHEMEYKRMDMMRHRQMCMKRDIPSLIAHHMNMMDMNIMVLQLDSNTPAPFCGAQIPLSPCNSPADNMMKMMMEEGGEGLENNQPRMMAHAVCIKNAMMNDHKHMLQTRNLYWVEGVEIEMDANDMYWLNIPPVAQSCVAFMIVTPANVAAGSPRFDVGVTAMNSLNSKLQTKYDMLRDWEDRNLEENGCRMNTLYDQLALDDKIDAMRFRETLMGDDMDDMDMDGRMDMDSDGEMDLMKMMEMKMMEMMQPEEHPELFDLVSGALYQYKFGAYRRAQRGLAHAMFGEWIDHMPSLVERAAMQAHRATKCEPGEDGKPMTHTEGTTDIRRGKLGSTISDLMTPMDGGEPMLNAASRGTIAEMSCRLWALSSTRIIQAPCMDRPMDYANMARVMMMKYFMYGDEDMGMGMNNGAGAGKKPTKGKTQGGFTPSGRGGRGGMPDMGMGDYGGYDDMYADCPFLSFPEDWLDEVNAAIYTMKQERMKQIKKRIMNRIMAYQDRDKDGDDHDGNGCNEGPLASAVEMFTPEAQEMLMMVDPDRIFDALSALLANGPPPSCNCPCDQYHGRQFQCKRQTDAAGTLMCRFDEATKFCVPTHTNV